MVIELAERDGFLFAVLSYLLASWIFFFYMLIFSWSVLVSGNTAASNEQLLQLQKCSVNMNQTKSKKHPECLSLSPQVWLLVGTRASLCGVCFFLLFAWVFSDTPNTSMFRLIVHWCKHKSKWCVCPPVAGDLLKGYSLPLTHLCLDSFQESSAILSEYKW